MTKKHENNVELQSNDHQDNFQDKKTLVKMFTKSMIESGVSFNCFDGSSFKELLENLIKMKLPTSRTLRRYVDEISKVLN